ncbi:MAG: BamA/TamA family outer membrane protein [Candidatus Aminicenantales bacterium]
MPRRVLGILLAMLAVAAVRLPADLAGQENPTPPGSYKSFSPFPIVMFDTDIGFGYGGRVKFVDYLGKKESFDLILFNSTKGEHWYAFSFSIPDLEIRQGKRYGLSFDLKAEYDKYLSYSFYGTGPAAPEADRTIFTYETINIPLSFGRGLTPHLVLEVAYAFRWVRYTEPLEGGPYFDEIAALAAQGRRFVPYVSLALRYDTSDSQIHPTRGVRVIFQDDLAGRFVGSRDAAFNRVTVDFRNYQRVFGAKDVFAVRALAQYVAGSNIPLFDNASLGGGNVMAAMRGYALNRFLDRGKFLINAEYRFPLLWRFGGNVFCDTGTVWRNLRAVDLGRLAFDAGVGLRFYMPDFVARVDVAWSAEGMGLYFNFGHIF